MSASPVNIVTVPLSIGKWIRFLGGRSGGTSQNLMDAVKNYIMKY